MSWASRRLSLNDLLKGWYLRGLLDEISKPPPTSTSQTVVFSGASSNPGCLLLPFALAPLLEGLLLSLLSFQIISHPLKRAAWPGVPSLGYPAFLGAVAAVSVVLLYLILHQYFPLTILLTLALTPGWALLGHALDGHQLSDLIWKTVANQGWRAAVLLGTGQNWTYGLLFGALALLSRIALYQAFRSAPKDRLRDLLVPIVIGAVIVVGIFWMIINGAALLGKMLA